MNRLQSELSRLYLPLPDSHAQDGAPPPGLIDPSNKVRAMVLELSSPPGWDALAPVWHGVQTELELPAPAIAVSGIDSLQLWFSLAQPIAVPRAHAFLAGLQQRYLADIDPARVRLMPLAEASSARQDLHAALVPAFQIRTGNWSAFLAPDLVPVFADTPWLDIPPNEEGQASLLRGIDMMETAAFDMAFEKLLPGAQQSPSIAAVAASAAGPQPPERFATAGAAADAQRFLLQVMHDTTVALTTRVEAAKALLQHASASR
ncbi:MAG: hypothetical protein ABIR55_00940 [Burkholderiaceae bacterium]